MKKILNKIVNWMDDTLGKWPRFIITHSIVGGIVTALTYVVSINFGAFWAGILAGTLVLIFKEFGEITGKEKERGEFVNDLDGNIENLVDSVDDFRSLVQSVGAIALLLIVVGAVKLVL